MQLNANCKTGEVIIVKKITDRHKIWRETRRTTFQIFSRFKF